MSQAGLVPRAEPPRHDERCEALPDDLGRGPSEQPFGLGVPGGHDALLVHDDHRVERRVEERAQHRPRGRQRRPGRRKRLCHADRDLDRRQARRGRRGRRCTSRGRSGGGGRAPRARHAGSHRQVPEVATTRSRPARFAIDGATSAARTSRPSVTTSGASRRQRRVARGETARSRRAGAATAFWEAMAPTPSVTRASHGHGSFVLPAA